MHISTKCKGGQIKLSSFYLFYRLMYIASGVRVTVNDPVINVTELDNGVNDEVSSCISTNITQTLERDVVFNLEFNEARSTAQLDNDFSFTPSSVTIPSGSLGYITMCFNTTITGDDVVEDDERIVYNLVALYDLDTVFFPVDPMYLIVNIVDNDGKDTQINISFVMWASF